MLMLLRQGQPGSASNDWDAIWLQLSGISLCRCYSLLELCHWAVPLG
jgi:hypothetical protein